jgi:hypothetical protein
MEQVTRMDDDAGFGTDVIRRLRAGLQLEDTWTVQASRSMTWWAGRLAQQIWVDPPSGIGLDAVQRVHVATDLLTGVPAGDSERLSALNRFAILSALVLDPRTGELALHTAAALHRENLRWVEPLLLTAISLQVAQAHAEVDSWAQQLGGQPADSAHPQSGPRKEPAERLDILDSLFARIGGDPTPFGDADMDAAMRLDPAPWVVADRAGVGFVAELTHGEDEASLPRGQLTVSAETRHPLIGSGCAISVTLRLPPGPEPGVMAMRLNLAEATESAAEWHLFGAWCAVGEGEVSFVTFLPAAVYEPGLLPLLCWNAAQRARWARKWLENPPPEEPSQPEPEVAETA